MTTAGPNSPSAANGIGWANPTNIFASDNVYTTNSTTGIAIRVFNSVTGFGFAIPTGVTITGITVEMERHSNNSNASDTAIQLIKVSETAVGANRSAGATWGLTDAYAVFGSSSDLWGTTWTPAEINASSFGMTFSAGAAGATTFSVDHVRVTVDYATITTSTRTVSPTARLMATLTRTLAATARLMQTQSRTITATARLTNRFTRTISPTARLIGSGIRTISPTARLKSTGTRAISPTARLTYHTVPPLHAVTRTSGANNASGMAASEATTNDGATDASLSGPLRAVLTGRGGTKARIT